MLPDVRAGWSKVHKNPWVAWLSHSLAFASGSLVAGTFLLAGIPWFRWPVHVAAVYTLAFGPVQIVGTLAYGLAFNATTMWHMCAAAHTLAIAPASFIVVAGPIEYTMFRNRLISLAVVTVSTCCWAFSAVMAPTKLPDEPMTSVLPPLLAAADLTSRFMNAYTDAAIVRLILEQAQSPCYWFGNRIPCSRLRWKAAAAAVFCATHFCCTAVRLNREPNKSKASSWNKKAAAIALGVACVAEVANVTIALLKLASDSQLPGRDMSPTQAAHFRQDAAFTVTSCVLSLGAVVLDAVGFKRILQLLQAGASRLRQSARSALPSWQVVPATADDAASESSDGSSNLAAPEHSMDEGGTTGVGATLDAPPQLTMQCDADGGDV